MKRERGTPDARLTEKARLTVLEARKDEGRIWFCPDEGPFKVARFLVWACGALLVLLLTATLIGELLLRGDLPAGGDNYNKVVSEMRTTVICLALTAVALISCAVKQYGIGGALGAAEGVLFLISQNRSVRDLLIDGGWVSPLLYLLPTALLAIAGLYLLTCDAAERIRIKRMKNDFLRRIAAAHPAGEGEITTADAWDGFIEEFLAEPVHERPKRSLKDRKKKGEKED